MPEQTLIKKLTSSRLCVDYYQAMPLHVVSNLWPNMLTRREMYKAVLQCRTDAKALQDTAKLQEWYVSST